MGLRHNVRIPSRLPARVLSIALLFVAAQIGLVRMAPGQEVSARLDGRIEGRLIRTDGKGVAGATAVLVQTGASELTGSDGQFSFSRLPPGIYSISLALGTN